MRVVLWALVGIVAVLAAYLLVERWWPQGEGRLVVLSDPPGAQVWIDLMATPATTNTGPLRLKAGRHSVTLRSDTLEAEPFAHAVDIRPGRCDTIRFRLIAPPPSVPLSVAVRQIAEAPPPGMTEEKRPAERDTVTRPPRIALPPREEPVLPRRRELPAMGALEVSSTLLGARIYVNDSLRPEVTPATLSLSPGNYEVRVELDGYVAEPPEQTVRLPRSEIPQFVFFTLTEDPRGGRQLVIETSPVSGPIFVDSVLAGEGSVSVVRELGSYLISFGEVEGFKTPEPQRVSLTPKQTRVAVKGVYTRIFRVSAQADGENSVKTEGEIRWEVGAYLDGRAQPSASLGPRIKEIPGTQKFGWEMAAGDLNRNPVGGDYVEFIFNLPPDVPPDSPLGLRLYLYRSGRRYPLTVNSRSELVILVNGRKFLDGYRPAHMVAAAEYDRYEEWALAGMLKTGENRVTIRIADDNTLFHYLWKIEIR